MLTLHGYSNGKLVYPAEPTSNSITSKCDAGPTTLVLGSPPYKNYFYGDCHSTSQVVVTSPLPDSNLSIIGPRVIVAWPAGNSGVAAYFAPANGINGTLSIQIQNSSSGSPLEPIYTAAKNGNATVGITTQVEFNSSAILSLAILGSIRTIRDFTEGPSILHPEIQNVVQYSIITNGVELKRLWLDNITTTSVSFTGLNDSIQLNNQTVQFEAGTYTFNASFNYPQLTQLSSNEVLSPASADLIQQSPTQSTSLSFLSYTTKLTAGAWRFLTYFGRDTMIAALLLDPVLSSGEGGAIEAVLAGVLERINSTDGSVCHEETIGDYATWTNLQNNITSTAPLCSYIMIDSDYYLPVVMERYFLHNKNGTSRASSFLETKTELFPTNANLTYKQLAQINANKIVTLAAPFVATGNQTEVNLMHLKADQIVGEWRDSTYGIGGGRIPFDVNSALVPAALRAIASLSSAGILDFNSTLINDYAQVWEDYTLAFFEINIDQSTAQSRLKNYTQNLGVANLSSQSQTLDGNVTFHALSLEGDDNLSRVAVMNTDSCFRLFLLNTTNQDQLTSIINATANNIQRPFPAGLWTDVGLLVANPAFGDNPTYAENFTRAKYHGTVVWSWPLAMMGKGLELQLSRCNSSSSSSSAPVPDFCNDTSVYTNVKNAYNKLWDVIEANEQYLSTEVWSWGFENGNFTYVDLGVYSPTESDIVQLWSLTFLAVKRNENFG